MIVEKTLNFLSQEERESKKGNKYQVINFLDGGEVVKVLNYSGETLNLSKFQQVKVRIKVVLGKYSRFELQEIL